jgi:hypothetical protein
MRAPHTCSGVGSGGASTTGVGAEAGAAFFVDALVMVPGLTVVGAEADLGSCGASPTRPADRPGPASLDAGAAFTTTVADPEGASGAFADADADAAGNTAGETAGAADKRSADVADAAAGAGVPAAACVAGAPSAWCLSPPAMAK